MRREIIGIASAVAMIGGLLTATTSEAPSAQARANIHSGGRTGGFANHRVGCGGCKDNPASAGILGSAAGVQLLRTSVHSGGRVASPGFPGGRAAPRLGAPSRSGFSRYPKSMGWV